MGEVVIIPAFESLTTPASINPKGEIFCLLRAVKSVPPNLHVLYAVIIAVMQVARFSLSFASASEVSDFDGGRLGSIFFIYMVLDCYNIRCMECIWGMCATTVIVASLWNVGRVKDRSVLFVDTYTWLGTFSALSKVTSDSEVGSLCVLGVPWGCCKPKSPNEDGGEKLACLISEQVVPERS